MHIAATQIFPGPDPGDIVSKKPPNKGPLAIADKGPDDDEKLSAKARPATWRRRPVHTSRCRRSCGRRLGMWALSSPDLTMSRDWCKCAGSWIASSRSM